MIPQTDTQSVRSDVSSVPPHYFSSYMQLVPTKLQENLKALVSSPPVILTVYRDIMRENKAWREVAEIVAVSAERVLLEAT